MKTIKAGEFKAKCLKMMDEVARTGEPYVITKKGKPVAQLAPLPHKRKSLYGALKGQVVIQGDIVGPIGDAWDVEK
jgi:prevent-host-death family protein